MIIHPYCYAGAGASYADEVLADNPLAYWKLDEALVTPTIADADTKTGTQASAANTWTLEWPSNIAAGDLILVIPASTGWVWHSSNTGSLTLKLQLGFSSGGYGSMLLLAKVAAGTETGTFTITLDGSVTGTWRCMRIPAAQWFGGSLAATTGAFSDSGLAGTWARGTSVSSDPPNLAPTGWAGALWIAATSHPDATTTHSAYPSGYTGTAEQTGGSVALGIARKAAFATSEDPGAFTLTASEAWHNMIIAVRPPSILPQDSSGNGYHMTTVVGAPQLGVAGIPDGADEVAINFPVASTYFERACPAALELTTWTLEAWYYSNAGTPGDKSFLIGMRYSAGSRYWLHTGDVGQNRINGGFHNGSHRSIADSQNPVATATWQHHAITWDGTNLRLYRNGSLVTGPTSQAGGIPSVANALAISRGWDNDNSVMGRLCHVAIYGSALSAARLAAHYAAGS